MTLQVQAAQFALEELLQICHGFLKELVSIWCWNHRSWSMIVTLWDSRIDVAGHEMELMGVACHWLQTTEIADKTTVFFRQLFVPFLDMFAMPQVVVEFPSLEESSVACFTLKQIRWDLWVFCHCIWEDIKLHLLLRFIFIQLWLLHTSQIEVNCIFGNVWGEPHALLVFDHHYWLFLYNSVSENENNNTKYKYIWNRFPYVGLCSPKLWDSKILVLKLYSSSASIDLCLFTKLTRLVKRSQRDLISLLLDCSWLVDSLWVRFVF